MTLRAEILKLAHDRPDLRPHLIPLLRQKQAGLQSLVGGQIAKFDNQMMQFAHAIKAKILGALPKEDSRGWQIGVGFFFDREGRYSIRVEVYNLTDYRVSTSQDVEQAIGAALGVSPSQLADSPGAFGNRGGMTYESAIQIQPGVVSTER